MKTETDKRQGQAISGLLSARYRIREDELEPSLRQAILGILIPLDSIFKKRSSTFQTAMRWTHKVLINFTTTS